MEHARIGSEEFFMEVKGGKSYTIADIEALPEGERAELIDGEMFMMAAPTWTHQDILVNLLFEIELYIRKNRGKCRVLPAPFGVYIKNDNRNYVEPDISVICDEEKRRFIVKRVFGNTGLWIMKKKWLRYMKRDSGILLFVIPFPNRLK